MQQGKNITKEEVIITAIKTGMNKLCLDNDMKNLIQTCVLKVRLIACEASLLASFHVLRLLEIEKDIPEMNSTFFDQCIGFIANATITKKY